MSPKYVTVFLFILYSIWEQKLNTHLFIKPLSWNKTLKMPTVCKFCALIGCQFAQKVHTKCAKLVDAKKLSTVLLSYKCWTKCSIERYIVYPKNQKQVCHLSMSLYSFLFCTQYEKNIFIISLNNQTLKLKQNTQNAWSVSFVH